MNKISLIILFLLLAFNSCTNSISDSGGASETVASINIENQTIKGNINNPGIYTVKIFDNQYKPNIDTSSDMYRDTILTDNSGQFNLDIPIKSFYNIYIFDNLNNSLKFDSVLISDSNYTLLDTLNKSGELNLSLNLTNTIINDSIKISIIGSDYSVYTNINNEIYLSDIPQGKYSLYYEYNELEDTINNDSTNVNNSQTITDINVGSQTEDIIITIQ